MNKKEVSCMSEEKRKGSEQELKIRKLANQVLSLARDNILVSLRFLDIALADLKYREAGLTGMIATDGGQIFYDSHFILKAYQKEPKAVTRMLLHILLHCIFYHSFQYDKVDRELWNMAVDMAVENVIIEMKLPMVTLQTDPEAELKLRVWKEDAGGLTAEKLYRYMKLQGISNREKQEIHRLFYRDSHHLWEPKEEYLVNQKQWQRISERIKADLKSFTKSKSNMESLEKNLGEATRDRYDYSEILRRFTVMGEDVSVNQDEFDYIYYTYGLAHYGNMPLIEPLEYRESRKVKEFVVALDTSASCRGEVVKAFLNKTYSILKSTENFFTRINVHIILCDSEVRQDIKITCDEELEAFIKTGRLTGFGTTDFRPVFEYVNGLKEKGEFENLKGVIYFTDGYGIYPEVMPPYEVIFAFLHEDEYRAPVPPWSMKVILDDEM